MKLSKYQMLEALDAGDWTTAVRLVRDEFDLRFSSIATEIRKPMRISHWREVFIRMPGTTAYEWTPEDGFLQVPGITPISVAPSCVIWYPNAPQCQIMINL